MSVPLSSPEAAVEVPSASVPPSPPAPVAPVVPTTPVAFPLSWLLEHAPAPIRFRALTEVARAAEDPDPAVAGLPYSHAPALFLAITQRVDGSWNDRMFGVPAEEGEWPADVGTIPAVLRLLEYGWDRESPPLLRARRLLFRLLAEDEDPSFLYELAADAGFQSERRAERSALRVRQAVPAVEHRHAELVEAGEGQLHLGLDAGGTHDAAPHGPLAEVVQ